MADTKSPLAQRVDTILRTGVFPTRRAIAAAIGMTESGFSRAVSDVDKGTLTVEQCLRLSAVLGETVGSILREAGRESLADFLEQRFQRADVVTRREMELVQVWRTSTPSVKHAIEGLMLALVPAPSARSGSRPRTRAMRRLVKRIHADNRAIAAADARLEEAKKTMSPRRAGSRPTRGRTRK
jgi:hypothetical protein